MPLIRLHSANLTALPDPADGLNPNKSASLAKKNLHFSSIVSIFLLYSFKSSSLIFTLLVDNSYRSFVRFFAPKDLANQPQATNYGKNNNDSTRYA